MRNFSLRLVIVFLLIVLVDTSVFRSGLYSQIMSIVSMPGYAFYFAQIESKAPASEGERILVTGDSKISEGFSGMLANTLTASSGLYFVQAGIPGSTLRVWYYLLKVIDPSQNRYKTIVIPVPTYRKTPYEENMADRTLDIDFLMPLINFRDALDLARSYPDMTTQRNIVFRDLFRAQNYQTDFQNLLLHPIARFRDVTARRKLSSDPSYGYEGRSETMEGLKIDTQSGKVSVPSRLTPKEVESVQLRFGNPPVGKEKEFEMYSTYWLSRIVELYKDAPTKFVVLRMPITPLPEVMRKNEGDFAQFMEELPKNRNVTIMDEKAFADLESGRFFFDTLHMNHAGRVAFTDRLAHTILAEKKLAEGKKQ